MPGLIKQRQSLHGQLRESETRIGALEEQIRATQKMATMGTMACLVAHEFNNILMPMINYAELALQHEDDEALVRKALEKTIEHGNRASLVIQSMLGLVRDQGGERRQVMLADLLDETLQCIARNLSKDQITVERQIPEGFQVYVVPGQLLQVMLNLIINARQAMLEGGGILHVEACEQENMAMIRLRDSGCGIEPELIDQIFEPFVSTKADAELPDQRGTGLGLMVCRNIIEAHGGRIEVQSKPGQGATFTMWLATEKTARDQQQEN